MLTIFYLTAAGAMRYATVTQIGTKYIDGIAGTDIVDCIATAHQASAERLLLRWQQSKTWGEFLKNINKILTGTRQWTRITGTAHVFPALRRMAKANGFRFHGAALRLAPALDLITRA